MLINSITFGDKTRLTLKIDIKSAIPWPVSVKVAEGTHMKVLDEKLACYDEQLTKLLNN